jgi:hypothetical protein
VTASTVHEFGQPPNPRRLVAAFPAGIVIALSFSSIFFQWHVVGKIRQVYHDVLPGDALIPFPSRLVLDHSALFILIGIAFMIAAINCLRIANRRQLGLVWFVLIAGSFLMLCFQIIVLMMPLIGDIQGMRPGVSN